MAGEVGPDARDAAPAEASPRLVPQPKRLPKSVSARRQPAKVPDFVDFDSLVDARFRSPVLWDQYKDRFEMQYGQIYRSFFSASGAVLLYRRVFHLKRLGLYWFGRAALVSELQYRPPAELGTEFARTLFRADQIVTEAKRTLRDSSLLFCLEMVHSALTYLFKVVDPVVPPDLPKKDREAQRREAIKVVSEHLRAAEEFYVRAGARRAVMYYLFGILVGIVLLGGGLMVAAPYLTRLPIAVNSVIVGSSLAAGGLGSVLSVMIRMSRGQLLLPQDVSNAQLVLIGSFRPAIGVLSGVLMYVILNSGLLPLQVPRATGTLGGDWYFYVVAAFVAGFSERLVQDTIVRAENQLVSRSDSKSG